jgi:hypothetical protein
MLGNTITATLSIVVIVFISVDIPILLAQTGFNLDGCFNNCGAPNGICIADGNKTDCTVTAYESCILYRCACVYGYSGNDCSLQYETCTEPITTSPDSAQQCFNGGTCENYRIDNTDNDNEDLQYGTRCNCQSLPNDAIAYAGHQCEYPATQTCVRNANHSTYAFCVNGGTCKKLINFNEEHPLCKCPTGFGGRYCEFKIHINPNGTFDLPDDERIYVNKIFQGNETVDLAPYTKDEELSGGMKFLIVNLVFVLCIVPFCYCYWIKKQRSISKASESTPTSMNKESDGTTNTEDEMQKDEREII